MNLADEIRQQIEKCKDLKLDIGEINNHLSTLEGLVRNDIETLKNEAYQKGYDKGYADKTNNDEVCKQIAKDIQEDAYQRGFDDAHRIGEEEYHRGLEEGKKAFDLLESERNFEYQRGLDDAWEAAKKIVEMTDPPYWEVFDEYKNDLFGKITASEAIAKLKAYEEKQKADDEIKVGDEVFNIPTKTKGILLEPETEHLLATVIVPSLRWRTINIRHANLKKTGKHYDIEKLLEAMKA